MPPQTDAMRRVRGACAREPCRKRSHRSALLQSASAGHDDGVEFTRAVNGLSRRENNARLRDERFPIHTHDNQFVVAIDVCVRGDAARSRERFEWSR